MAKVALPDENHLLLQLAIRVGLWADFKVKVDELLELLVAGTHHVHDDGHQQRVEGIAVEHCKDDLAHGLDFDLVRALLDPLAEGLGPDLLVRIGLVDDGVASVCCAHGVSVFVKKGGVGWSLERSLILSRQKACSWVANRSVDFT